MAHSTVTAEGVFAVERATQADIRVVLRFAYRFAAELSQSIYALRFVADSRELTNGIQARRLGPLRVFGTTGGERGPGLCRFARFVADLVSSPRYVPGLVLWQPETESAGADVMTPDWTPEQGPDWWIVVSDARSFDHMAGDLSVHDVGDTDDHDAHKWLESTLSPARALCMTGWDASFLDIRVHRPLHFRALARLREEVGPRRIEGQIGARLPGSRQHTALRTVADDHSSLRHLSRCLRNAIFDPAKAVYDRESHVFSLELWRQARHEWAQSRLLVRGVEEADLQLWDPGVWCSMDDVRYDPDRKAVVFGTETFVSLVLDVTGLHVELNDTGEAGERRRA